MAPTTVLSFIRGKFQHVRTFFFALPTPVPSTSCCWFEAPGVSYFVTYRVVTIGKVQCENDEPMIRAPQVAGHGALRRQSESLNVHQVGCWIEGVGGIFFHGR